ncbi:MAG: hypothetical protein M1292_12830 [Bacteroidetes bacterium]|nr:hypothetical protein [Bacteroidota bacterium]
MLQDTYFFNPTCEPAIANGSPYYTAPARLRKLEADLGYLPGWLGEEKDLVLVQGTVDPGFELKMKKLGFKLPEFIKLDQALSDAAWIAQPKGRLNPWGWSPALYQLFKNVLPSYQVGFQQSAVANWLPDHKNLYSRSTGIGLLDQMLGQDAADWLPGRRELPVVCTTLVHIYDEINKHKKAVVKSPWSSSGRGLLLFPNVDTKKKNDEVLSGMLNQQGFVTVEPWLDKVMDLSYQFFSLAGTISYRGRTIFETDQKGRYIRNFLTDKTGATDEVSSFLEAHDAEVVSRLLGALLQSGYATLYEGWIGVDALIYRSDEGILKFHPLIEINGRFTMGAIALKIKEYLAAGSKGFMQLFYSKTVNFQSFCNKQEAEKPLVMEDKKIISGFLTLTPPLPEHHFGAYMDISC